MSAYLPFLLLGLGNGAVFGSLALALVVTYRSSQVLNFATATMGLFSAYTYVYLRRGQLPVLLPWLPKTVDIGVHFALFPAIIGALAISALFSLLCYVVIFRPLRRARPVARAVASLGLMVLIQAMAAQKLGTDAIPVGGIFPRGTLSLPDNISVPMDRVWFAVTVVIVTLIVAAGYRFTRFGLNTRAATETEKGAVVSGLNPDRIAAANWMISGAVAGLAGILIAPIVPMVPVAYTLFIVPALAAALVGQFQYILPAVGAGFAIGMIQSELTYLTSRYASLPQTGLPELVPLVLILLVLVVRGRPLPTRGSIITQNLGRAPRPRRLWPTAVIATAAALVGVLVLHGNWRDGLITSFILGIIALSLVVVSGYAGQISLAQLTLAGASAFLLSRFTYNWGVPFPIAPLLAALGATVFGVLLFLPAIRIRGLSLAITTLAVASAMDALWFNNDDLNGGYLGAPVSTPKIFGLNLGVGAGKEAPRAQFGVLCLVVLVAVAVGVALLRRSRLGAAMLAVRANERSAAAAGVSVVRTKLLAFALAAFIAGLGGALFAYHGTTVSPNSFAPILGLGFFATVYIAGITSVAGGLVAGIIGAGGLVFYASNHWIKLGSWWEALTGLSLIFTVLKNPEGIVGPIHAQLERRRAKRLGAVPTEAEVAEESAPVTPLRRRVTPEPGAARQPLLSVSHVGVRYGGVVAVDDVSIDVYEGQIFGIIGPNGAGKTTLLDALSGFASCTGEVQLDGRPLGGLAPHQRVRAGLGRTFQALELYDDMTVLENVEVGLTAGKTRGVGWDDFQRALQMLDLGSMQERRAGELSQGQRQLVSIARGLVGRPQVLLLDEPAAGLDSTESMWLGERLRRVRDSGTTIVLIDHDMQLVLDLCDQLCVLNFGHVVASGPPVAIRSDPRVAEAYLGAAYRVSEEGAS